MREPQIWIPEREMAQNTPALRTKSVQLPLISKPRIMLSYPGTRYVGREKKTDDSSLVKFVSDK